MNKLTKIVALVGSILFAMMYINTASADSNPFAKADNVQTIIGEDEGKCGDKKDKKKKDGKCGEHKDKKKKDSKCGEHKDKKKKDGKCGEGKCGDDKGKKKKKKEGKCGEGKCGSK